VSANSELAYLCPNERPYDMSPSGIQLRVGDLYSNDEIQTALNVGNAGGIRVRLDDSRQPRRIAILTSSPDARQQTENPYGDRIEGDILVYTAGGREGDQTLAGINKRVPEQLLKEGMFARVTVLAKSASQQAEGGIARLKAITSEN
jgi:hypothetical protein